MKLIDKLLDILADKVVERMENKNTVMINGEKMKAQIEKQKYDDEMVKRILKGHTGEIKGNDIKLKVATTHEGVIADKIS